MLVENEKLSTKRETLNSLGKSIMAGLSSLIASHSKPERQLIEYFSVVKTGRSRVIGKSEDLARSEEFRALCRILRACIRGDRDAPWFKNELQILETGANQKVSLKSEAFSKSGPYFIRIGGSIVRKIVNEISQYTQILASDKRLVPHGPIGVCNSCELLFLKTKRNQKFCTTKCRVANWSDEKGKEYFAARQRQRRARVRRMRSKPGDNSPTKITTKAKKMVVCHRKKNP